MSFLKRRDRKEAGIPAPFFASAATV
ncbi:Protein of unknown function [Bacillus mycoides]|uniref:Uncharacterized protein n=1 Tax=Bacillus mycoides TaxID=1405 RepID=A0A1G4ELS6_BACMY|nr:Protein of unknown function [Bacillus mycoides]